VQKKLTCLLPLVWVLWGFAYAETAGDGGIAGGAEQALGTNSTVITGERLEFDYKRYIAVFEENVVVEDPQIRIESDRLTVCFDGTNDVKSVTALGRVRMKSEDKRATCDKAVYLASSGEVIMTGSATLHRDKDYVSGERIIFWIDEDRMECTPGRLIIHPGRKERTRDSEDAAR